MMDVNSKHFLPPAGDCISLNLIIYQVESELDHVWWQ